MKSKTWPGGAQFVNVVYRKVMKMEIKKAVDIEALEKQIPQNVIVTETSNQACPICKSNVNWKYCSNCGQKLDYNC